MNGIDYLMSSQFVVVVRHVEENHKPLYLDVLTFCFLLVKMVTEKQSNFFFFFFFLLESQNVDFICSVLVVADQLLITRLKETCEGALTEKREYQN